MIAAINYRPWQRGSVMGIFDLIFYSATVRGCKVMTGKGGFWISLPQQSYTDKNNETKYSDVVQMTSALMNHVRRIVTEQLIMEGHLAEPSKPRPAPAPQPTGGFRNPDTNEDLSMHVTTAADDDIPF